MVTKKGVCRGPSFLGRMRAPLRYNLSHLLARKGARGMVERVFSTLLG